MSAKRRWSVIKRRTSIVPQVIFDPRKTFKTAITCVRFLVRLKHIRTTPVLLSLEQTRVKPYTMRNYRRSIDRHAFGLYNHWIKKDQAQDRAAVFQTSPKRDMKTKNKSSSFWKKIKICYFITLYQKIQLFSDRDPPSPLTNASRVNQGYLW